MDGRQKRNFIKEVKKYPVLWRTSPAAPPKQRALKWQKVADRFGMTSEEVQGEWKRLQQARRAAQWRRSYTPQEKLWKYEEDMSFLGDISIRKNSQPIVPLVRLNIEGTGAVTSGENSASTSTSTSTSTSGDTSAASAASASGDTSAASASGDTNAGSSAGSIVIKKEVNPDVNNQSIIILDDDCDDIEVEAEMMRIVNKKLGLIRAVRDTLRTEQREEFVRGLDPMLSDAICHYFRKFC